MIRKPLEKRILIVEDDRTLSRLLAEQLNSIGYSVSVALNWAESKEALTSFEPALVILDMRLPDADGMRCLPDITPEYPVIVLTAFGSIKQAVDAMRAGAIEYLVKPVNPAELEVAVGRAFETTMLKQTYNYMRTQLHPGIGSSMMGRSEPFEELTRFVELVAAADTNVLIQGESGVGKELVARSIHQLSNRACRNLVTIDCCTLQESLLESELFGYEKGAFTGANRRKEGLMEIADGGTVFLDEIGEISPAIQGKLLRVLETGEFRRLGGTRSLSTDARFVMATNRDLKALSMAGQFRNDLYYRLSSVVISVPPLRERRGDIGLLANHFLDTRCFQRHIKKHFARGAVRALMQHDWPGNIRELRNVVERATMVSGDSNILRAEHLGLPAMRAGTQIELKFDHEPTISEVQRTYLARLLEQHCGHRAHVASIMGISERNTYRLIKKLKLDRKRPLSIA